MTLRITGLWLLLAGSLAAAAAGEDWPQFLGPRADGTSLETGLIDQFPKGGPPVAWQRDIGTGYSAPSVRSGWLVLHHRVKGEEVVESFDAATGKPRWRFGYPSGFIDPFGYNNGPRCSPLLTADRCYTFGAEGKLLCLELTTGKLVWQRDTAKDWSVPEAFFGVGSTPILEGDRLIVMVGGQPNSGMVAFDARTGKTLWENVGKSNWSGVTTLGWRAERPYEWTGHEKSAGYGSPVAATIHGQRHIFCFMRQGLCSVNPTNGAVNFSRWFQSQANDSVNAINPVVRDDLVLISAAYYRSGAVLLRVKPGGKSFDEVWKDPARHPMDAADRDPATGEWKVPALEIHWTTPIVHEGHVYAFSGRNEPDATFRCVEFRTGKLKWSRDERWAGHQPKAQPPVFGRGSAILADGKLYALGEGGLLGIFRPNAQRIEELARWQAPQLSYPTWAAPILAQRRLYLRSEDKLLCLNLARP